VLAITNMYPAPAHPDQGVFVEQQVLGLRRIGVDVDVLHLERTARGMQVYFDMAARFEAALRRSRIDVVHIMYGGVMAERALRYPWRQPTVVTFHGSDLLGENLSGWTRRAIAHVGVLASRRAARRADAVVAVSRVVERALPAGMQRRNVHVIPCGIDLDRFVPLDRQDCERALGWRAGAFHVLFPANTGDPVKRPALAAAAVEQLTASGVPAELHYLRGVPNHEVPRWLNACHALLLTSLHEGSPTVVKEALACDIPVVSVDVGDVSERIEGIEGCYLADPAPEAIAAALARVARSGDRVKARARVASLSHVAIAERLRELYTRLLDGAGRAGGIDHRVSTTSATSGR
jgi:glycosyltransferase involved in cell wall biosynthesis